MEKMDTGPSREKEMEKLRRTKEICIANDNAETRNTNMSPSFCLDITVIYCFHPKYLVRQARTNNTDPDQMPQNMASDLGLHCLSLIQQ